ncbi:MAG: glycosyltransferase involved in cell wall biosynthesis, partial [Psychroserpens sp.]
MTVLKNDIQISVVIPVYNAIEHIVDTIESVINQTEENINIIVIDDGSTDETPSKLIEYKESINNIRI